MHLYFFSPIPWHFLHQRPQKLAEEFHRLGFAVTFVEPSSWRDYLSGTRRGFVWAVLRSLLSHFRLARPLRAIGVYRTAWDRREVDGIRILSLPLTYPIGRGCSALTALIVRGAYRHFLTLHLRGERALAEGGSAIVESPLFGPVLRRSEFQTTIYDSLDDLRLHVGKNSLERFLAYERRLLSLSDHVVATSEAIEKHIQNLQPERVVHRIPNGVNYERFNAQVDERNLPSRFLSIPHPIAGFVGCLFWWIDFDLLEHLAGALPEVSIVCVGPVSDESALTRCRLHANFHWFGQIPYSQVSSYMNRFDVCMLPFRRGPISAASNPVKLYEYFALGKPVVSIGLPEVVPFASGGLAVVVESYPAFADAIRDCLRQDEPTSSEERRQIARESTWRNRASRFRALIGGQPAEIARSRSETTS